MKSVNMHDAKTHFSRLVDRVSAGETVVIAKAGRPVAQLSPLRSETRPPQRTGFLIGAGTVPDEFNRLGSREIATSFGLDE